METPAEYIAAVDDKRRSDIAALDALIRKHTPKLEPVIIGGMLGYGPFHYRYASGREGDACKLSIASNASYISLYCFAADASGFVAGGTSTGSQRPASANRVCGSRSSRTSTRRRSSRSSKRPRR